MTGDSGSTGGLRYRLDGSVQRLDEGRLLLGGSPLVMLRLSDAGARFVDRVAAGGAVPTTGTGRTLLDRLLDTGAAHPVAQAGAGPFTPADVTVVIPVKDRNVTRTVAGLGEVGRVLVVDDGSDPPLPVPPGCDLLRRPVAGGPSAARNAGLAAVTTPLVAFVDSDVVPTPGWLAPLLAHLADDRVALVAPRVRAPEPPAGAGTVARYERWRSALDLGPEAARVAPRTRVGFLPAAALLARTDVLAALGGFEESMQVGEDVDLVWRLHAAGHRVRYEPASEVHHDVRDGLHDWFRRRVDYGTSAGPLERRHPGTLAPLGVSGWTAAAWALTASGHPVAGTALAAGSAAALPRKLGGVPDPWRTTWDVAGRGHLAAWRPIASAMTRAWWPLTLAAALVSRRARRAALAAALAPPLLAWRADRPALDPVRATAMWLADDVAYGTGVWIGSWRSRTLGAIRPDLAGWPPRPRRRPRR